MLSYRKELLIYLGLYVFSFLFTMTIAIIQIIHGNIIWAILDLLISAYFLTNGVNLLKEYRKLRMPEHLEASLTQA